MIDLLRARTLMVGLGLALATLTCGQVASAQAGGPTPTPDFGTPPSGEIPILFNDHHVYSRPDRLKANRVLAALVKNGTILVPLRSMFEQTGATVTYDAKTKTVDVSKPGADVQVTVGKPLVVINGEQRPLDVPPEIYKGAVVVPVRVISEGMGAYVQWVGEKRLVVVRYLEAPVPTPSPVPATPPPTPPPTPAPTPTPSPTPPPKYYDHFIAGDYIFGKVYNELSGGNSTDTAFDAKAAIEFPMIGQTFMLKGDFRNYRYPHNSNFGSVACAAGAPNCNTVVGSDPHYLAGACPPGGGDPGCVNVVGFPQTIAFNGLGQAYVPAFKATDQDLDVRLGWRVADPRVYIGIGGYFKHFDYLGYPNLSGVGAGIDKLPDLDQTFSVYGSAWYYPNVSGKYTYPTSVFLGPLSGSTTTLSYGVLKYDAGLAINFGNGGTGFFLDGGFEGERANARTSAPANTSISGPYVGIGLHF